MKDWVIGIDLGATKIALGLVSPDGEVVASRKLPTQSTLGPQSAVERIAGAIGDITAEVGIEPGAVGVCSPGPIDRDAGIIIEPPNIQTWRNVPFRQMLSDRLGLPVAFEHDAKASALGEFHFGVGKQTGAKDMVYVIVGTGVGGAIILDGELRRGPHNAAGEIGHITISRFDPPGSSGVPGCVESYLSGPSLALRYIARTGARDKAEEIGGDVVVARAQSGDPDALAVMADAGDALAAGIATVAMLVDVEVFVIGGGVAKCGDLLLNPARASVHKYGFPSITSRIQIHATELHEMGAILGCAWEARTLLV